MPICLFLSIGYVIYIAVYSEVYFCSKSEVYFYSEVYFCSVDVLLLLLIMILSSMQLV